VGWNGGVCERGYHEAVGRVEGAAAVGGCCSGNGPDGVVLAQQGGMYCVIPTAYLRIDSPSNVN
jgi:hypothetical protein